MVKKRLVHRADINWGWLPLTTATLVFLIDFFYFFYFFQYIILAINTSNFSSIIVLTLIPILVLNGLFFPVLKALILRIMKKTDFQLYTTGIKIKGKLLNWSQIKSISFKTGRYKGKKAFFRGHRLPALQSIFILDKKGKEYSCIIDIDYSSKKNRKENNLRKIREFLLGMDKISLLSDWAEKK